MHDAPPPAPDTSSKQRSEGTPTDEDLNRYIDLLAIFHYIVAGLTCLFSLLPIVHLVLGIVIINGGFGPQETPPPAVLG